MFKAPIYALPLAQPSKKPESLRRILMFVCWLRKKKIFFSNFRKRKPINILFPALPVNVAVWTGDTVWRQLLPAAILSFVLLNGFCTCICLHEGLTNWKLYRTKTAFTKALCLSESPRKTSFLEDGENGNHYFPYLWTPFLANSPWTPAVTFYI